MASHRRVRQAVHAVVIAAVAVGVFVCWAEYRAWRWETFDQAWRFRLTLFILLMLAGVIAVAVAIGGAWRWWRRR